MTKNEKIRRLEAINEGFMAIQDEPNLFSTVITELKAGMLDWFKSDPQKGKLFATELDKLTFESARDQLPRLLTAIKSSMEDDARENDPTFFHKLKNPRVILAIIPVMGAIIVALIGLFDKNVVVDNVGQFGCRILSESGNPIEKAKVMLELRKGPPDTRYTDSNGAVTFDEVPLNSNGKLTVFAGGFEEKVLNVELKENLEIRLRFIVMSFYGKVVDEKGSPIGGVTVHLELQGESPRTLTSEPSGKFSFENIPTKSGILRFQALGFIPASQKFPTNLNDFSLSRIEELPPTAKEHRFSGQDITLKVLNGELESMLQPASGTSEEIIKQLTAHGSLVLDESTLVLGQSGAGQSVNLSVYSLELKNGARIVTNGNDFTIQAVKIIVSEGAIVSFTEGQPPAVQGQSGLPGIDAGNVTLSVSQIDGKLKVGLRGQNGGRGGQGNNGAQGAQGKRGHDGVDGLFECKRGGGDGDRGYPGGAGENGYPGGKGGNRGNLILRNRSIEESISLDSRGGDGGEGGLGGLGGAGGHGGQGGSGSAWCKGGHPGPPGPQGPSGQKGPDGERGDSDRIFGQ